MMAKENNKNNDFELAINQRYEIWSINSKIVLKNIGMKIALFKCGASSPTNDTRQTAVYSFTVLNSFIIEMTFSVLFENKDVRRD